MNKTQRRQKTMAPLCKFKLSPTCPNLPKPAPTCPCLLRHAFACPLFIVLKYIYKFNVRNGVGAIMRWCDYVQPFPDKSISASKSLLQSAIDSASCCLKLKTLHQTFWQLKSDKIIDGKKRRMFLLNKMYKGTVIS